MGGVLQLGACQVVPSGRRIIAAVGLLLAASGAIGSIPIGPDDVLALLDPNTPVPQQTWSGLNCLGQYTSIARFSAQAPGLAETSVQRFGVTTDPLGTGSRSYVFAVKAGDPLTAGALRCEALAPPAGRTTLPRGSAFWYAFRILVWQGQEAASGTALLTQWHVNGFNPFLGLYLGQGRLFFTVRHNQNVTASPGPTKALTLWRDPAPVKRRWLTFVVRATLHQSGESMVKLWRDGDLIVDYVGPLGYHDPRPAYAKIGYYHWLNRNPWDDSVELRAIYVSKAALVHDPAERYAEPQLRAWIGQ